MDTHVPPSPSTAAPTVARLRATFDRGRTRPLRWRVEQLEALARLLDDEREAILAALYEDLRKPNFEAFATEVSFLEGELRTAIRQLPRWTKPERVRTNLLAQPGRSHIHRDPLGVVLIIGPWNFPFGLVLSPLIGAIAAGNCALLKPSELSAATSALLATLIPKYLDAEAFAVIEGGVPETTDILEQRFDHVFFTGSTRVGRIVMGAAAKQLTPVTLELGGKCPVIVDRSAKLDVVARRVCWGKFSNAGQICLAPDYLLVHQDVYEDTLAALARTLRGFFGDDPQRSPDFARIINLDHVRRLAKLLEGETLVVGGQIDEGDRYIAPTVLRDVADDAPIMGEEIFGPILPVIPVRDVDAAIAKINGRPKPLALYVFTEDERVSEAVLRRTSSGGATINHTWIHVSVTSLPFGGVGESGMGAYHGRHSFETFSHRKGVLSKPSFFDPDLLYPPYDERKKKLLSKVM